MSVDGDRAATTPRMGPIDYMEAPRPAVFEQRKIKWKGSKRQSKLMLELSILKKQAQAGPNIDLYRRKCRALNSRVKQLEHDTAKRKVLHVMSRKQRWLNSASISLSGDLQLQSKLSLAYEELLKRDQLIETIKEQHNHLKKDYENSVSACHAGQRRNVGALTTTALLKQKNTVLTKQFEELRGHMSRIHGEKKASERHNEKLKQAIFNLENGITIENYKKENEMMIGTVNAMQKQIANLTSKLEKANQQILAQDLEIHKAFSKPTTVVSDAREHLKELVLHGYVHRAIGTSFHDHPETRGIAQQALQNFVRSVDDADLNEDDAEQKHLINTSNMVRMIQKMGRNFHKNGGKDSKLEIEEEKGDFDEEKFAHHTLESLTNEETTVAEVARPVKDENLDLAESKSEEANLPTYDVFLGGSCNPTTWRSEIAVGEFKSNKVSYYNPQRDDWSPALVALEAHVKKNCLILLFVIDKRTRSIASMLEATEYISTGRNVILACQDVEPGTEMYGAECNEGEIKDLNRARKYLLDVALRHGVPMFTGENCITEAIESITQKIKVVNFSSEVKTSSRTPSRGESRAAARLEEAAQVMTSRAGSRPTSLPTSLTGSHLLIPATLGIKNAEL